MVLAPIPTQHLSFFVVGDVNDDICARVRSLLLDLAAERKWSFAAPQLLHKVEDAGARPEDQPLETVGGILEIYSALQAPLPREIDLKTYNDVEHLVERIREFSSREGIDFEFELDGTYVGAIVAGQPDRSLSLGLLDEWRRQLGI